MKLTAFVLCLGALLTMVSCSANSGQPDSHSLVRKGQGILSSSTGWKLVWSDEFQKNGDPSDTVWIPEEYPPYAYNQELQAYRSRTENAFVKNGMLSIVARKDHGDGFDITSARLSSSLSLSFLYGRLEFRARLPKGRGTWPALWLLPLNPMGHGKQWPASGEIDVMESVGFEDNLIHGSLHTANFNWPMKTQITAVQPVDDVGQWHVYGIEWYPDRITFFVDDHEYMTFKKPSNDWRDWPFDKPFYLIMNVAIGGSWGGQNGVDDKIFPAEMDVDYVRLYQNRKAVPESQLLLKK